MDCTIYTYLLNDHFSIEYAKKHNNGKESELNRKYQWEDELSIADVKEIEEVKRGIFELRGVMSNGEEFCHEVNEMRLFNVSTESNSVAIGCSESILAKSELENNSDGFIIRIYIKDNEPLSNPTPGVYIASQEFPKELIL